MAFARYALGFHRFSQTIACRSIHGAPTLATARKNPLLAPLDTFQERHIGPNEHEVSQMLSQVGYDSMDAFIADTVPPKIRVRPLTSATRLFPRSANQNCMLALKLWEDRTSRSRVT